MPNHDVPKVSSPASMPLTVKRCTDHPQLKDPSLFKQECYVNGEWVKAKSGKTFEVTGTPI